MRGRRKRVSRNGNRCGSPDDLTDGKPRGVPQYPLDRNMPRKTLCAGCGHRPQGQPLCAPLCARKAQGRAGIPSRQRAALRASWSLADRLRRPAQRQGLLLRPDADTAFMQAAPNRIQIWMTMPPGIHPASVFGAVSRCRVLWRYVADQCGRPQQYAAYAILLILLINLSHIVAQCGAAAGAQRPCCDTLRNVAYCRTSAGAPVFRLRCRLVFPCLT